MSLTPILKFQAVVFVLYGVMLLLVPDFYNELLDWEGSETVFGRLLGGAFIGIGWLEWKVAPGADASDAWPFAAIPVLFVVALVWEYAADTYTGSDLWLWTNLGVSAFFALLVGGAAMSSRR